MANKIYLIRHGETENAHEMRYKGNINVPLSDNGSMQIGRLADFLAQHTTLNFVYSSPLSRTQNSAEIIAQRYHIQPIVVPQLREIDFGSWEGMNFEEVREKYPDEFDVWANDPLKQGPVNGETILQVRDRVMEAMEQILANNRNQNIAVVAHGAVNRVIIAQALGLPLNNIFRIEQDFAALSIIEFHRRFPVVRLLNGIFYR
jgi:alpha-ribazole phosphatase/probable phosphoglycerate mutase